MVYNHPFTEQNGTSRDGVKGSEKCNATINKETKRDQPHRHTPNTSFDTIGQMHVL